MMDETVREESATPAPGARRAGGRLRARLRRLPHWWPLPVCALLGAAGGLAFGVSQPAQYAATSYVVVVPAKGSDAATALGFAQAYGRVATSGAVLADAHHVSDVPLAALRGGVRATTSPDAPMIEITGTAAAPRASADIANAVARSLARAGNGTAMRTGAKLMVFSPATSPVAPSSPSVPIATEVGACAGGLMGGLLLLVRPRERRGALRGATVPAPAHGPAPTPGAKTTAREAAR
ncbi:lipopolysaccharide biosynthesis protein [Streptomyces sp. NPDC017993]|uniref:lipopolysaccharide biosynthesis protein n=1 Tax=Streptomyces sp. NPDC017993 TaxID=3365027 RepID=UPI0037A151A8